MGQRSYGGTEVFTGFGRSMYLPFRAPQYSLDVADDFADVRRAMRDTCPSRPGVYGMIDARGSLIYVGMSCKLRKRLVTYFQGGEAVRKERTIASRVDRLAWEVAGHELAAQLRELELIRRHQPRFNVKGRQRIRPLGFLYISAEEAPRVRTGRRIPRAARHAWGPMRIDWRVREAVMIVNRIFKLCDCPASMPMHFADQRRLFAIELRLQCLRGEIGTCLGPCAGQCTHGQYVAQVRAACEFLDGRDEATLESMESQLAAAVAARQFERAARLRDSLELLRNLAHRLAILREPPLPPQLVYPVQLRRRMIWYLIAHGVVAGVAPAPINDKTAARCLSQIQRIFHNAAEQPEVDRPAAQIVAGWFRRYPEERRAALSPAEAIARCARV
jgi:excinuclease ABC subunit C